MKKARKLKIALAHDYLCEYGGAERVLEALHELYHDAPVYVAFKDLSVAGVHAQKFANWDIRESWLTKIPFYKKLFSPLRIFAPHYFSSFDLSEYDVVISSTNAYFSKAVTVKRNQRTNSQKTSSQITISQKNENAFHITYCHTPARSLYGYTTMTDWKRNPLFKIFGTLINHYLRIKDVEIARNNVDAFIANSKETQRRIKKFYRLDSTVIYPPIEIKTEKKYSNTLQFPKKDGYFLVVGRIAASKHVDLAIKTANEMGINLKVVGTGKGVDYLKSIAGPTVEFLGGVDDATLSELYENATALLYPAEDEDFGMVPIEAMGHGIPVVAHKSGGPLETVQEGTNGYFFEQFTIESLGDAIKKITATKWNKQSIYKYALTFSKARFQKEISDFVNKNL